MTVGKQKEKPIVLSKADSHDRLIQSMAETQTGNIYESEKFKAACEYLKHRKLKIKPVRHGQ